jgi:hypothetical protein
MRRAKTSRPRRTLVGLHRLELHPRIGVASRRELRDRHLLEISKRLLPRETPSGKLLAVSSPSFCCRRNDVIYFRVADGKRRIPSGATQAAIVPSAGDITEIVNFAIWALPIVERCPVALHRECRTPRGSTPWAIGTALDRHW